MLILASTSPVRRRILERCGLGFICVAPNVQETIPPDRSAEHVAMALAEAKARSVAMGHPDAVVIGADQVCEAGGVLLGKPENAQAARAQLERLSGKTHRLVTGVTVFGVQPARGGVRRVEGFFDETRLTMRALSARELDAYIDTGEWQGSAGSYRLEGRGIHLMERIQGDYFNVLGLPLVPLLKVLRRFGINPLLPGESFTAD